MLFHSASNHTLKLPSFAAALWNSDAIGNDGSGEDEDHRKPKKRKHRSDDSEEDKISKKKKSKDAATSEESDSSENSSFKKSKRKRSKGRYGSDSGQEQEEVKRKKKNNTDSESSSDDGTSRKKSKKKKKKKSDLSSDDSDSEIDYRKSKSMKRSELETMGFDHLDTSAGSVYRALKDSAVPFAWMESPCGVCPSFEFCKPGGPVNPQECSYYGDWLLGETASNEIEELS
jgi:DNA-directed RNA polymerase III subunit RPC6